MVGAPIIVWIGEEQVEVEVSEAPGLHRSASGLWTLELCSRGPALR